MARRSSTLSLVRICPARLMHRYTHPHKRIWYRYCLDERLSSHELVQIVLSMTNHSPSVWPRSKARRAQARELASAQANLGNRTPRPAYQDASSSNRPRSSRGQRRGNLSAICMCGKRSPYEICRRRNLLTVLSPIVHDQLRVDVDGPVDVPEEEDDLFVATVLGPSNVGLHSRDGLDRASVLADVLHGPPAAIAWRSCKNVRHGVETRWCGLGARGRDAC